MPGTVYKRCARCSRRVPNRRCTNPECGSTSLSWAFSVRLGRRPNGTERRVFRSGFASKGAAEEALTAVLAERTKAHDAPVRLTVRDFLLERWLPRTRTSPKTYRDREMHIRTYIVPHIGAARLTDLTGDDLTEMYDDLAVRGRRKRPDPVLGWGLSPTSIRRIHTQLHKAFADAIRWGLLQRNPCEQADPPSTNEVKARALASRMVYDWEQLQRFLAVAREDRLFAMWHFLTSTGMRRSEVAALRWTEVDLDTRVVSVIRVAVEHGGTVYERELPKSSSSRRAVELSDGATKLLRQHRAQQAEERLAAGTAWQDRSCVFTTPMGGRLHPPSITRAFHDLTDQAGLPRMRLHGLRHTHATLLLKAGENTKVVTERLGHSTTAYTQDAYQHVLPGMQRGAATRFQDQLDGKPDDETDDPDDDMEDGA